IWVVAVDNADKGAHLTQLTPDPGPDSAPAWSPDGKWIAYVTELDPHLFYYNTRHLASQMSLLVPLTAAFAACVFRMTASTSTSRRKTTGPRICAASLSAAGKSRAPLAVA